MTMMDNIKKRKDYVFNMINKLHLAMIELYKGDAKRIQHFCKVHSYAKLIAETERVDDKTLFIIEVAALTHDIGIHLCEDKYGDCSGKLQEKEGPALAERLLKELGFEQDVSNRVQYLIAHHHTYDHVDGIDYQILIEADFLVNIMEDHLSKEAATKAYETIFKTECGKTNGFLLRHQYDNVHKLVHFLPRTEPLYRHLYLCPYMG